MSGAKHTPGQLLQQLSSAFFNGGGWADAPEWSDFDEAGHAEWERMAEVIGRSTRKAAAAPSLLEAANVALGALTGNMDGDWIGQDPVAMLRAAIAKATGAAS